MSVFCITFSVHTHTHTHKSHNLHYSLQVDSTSFHASKLVTNAGEVNRIESFMVVKYFCITLHCHLSFYSYYRTVPNVYFIVNCDAFCHHF